MKTVHGPNWIPISRSDRRIWTDRHSYFAISLFIGLVYCVFFSPVIRFDGIHYVAPARSLVIDGNLNTYDENFYFIQPGWNNVEKRQITGRQVPIISYVAAPDYTPRGYRYVVFPIGNTLTWLPAVFVSHFVAQNLNLPVEKDGFSGMYRIVLGWWSFIIGIAGAIVAYRILRFWFSPGVSCCALLFVFGSGNIIPFMTHDVTFSHSSDFFLINLSLFYYLYLRARYDGSDSSNNWRNHAVWGVIIGFSVIVRYQDIALLLLPFSLYILERNKNRHPMAVIAFAVAFFLTAGLQLTYWKILYGTFFVSPSLMGAGNLASFNPLQPQFLPMLFSRYHGLFNWMPWLLPVTLTYILFLKRARWFAWLTLALMASQLYYISTRTEWWNLGFSVRRVSGWSIFFMLGTAELISLVKIKSLKILLAGFGTLVVLWAWLFQIHFLMKKSPVSIFRYLISNASPHRHDSFQPVIPSFKQLADAVSGLKSWFIDYSWLNPILENVKDGRLATGVVWMLLHILFISVCMAVVICSKSHIYGSMRTRIWIISLMLIVSYGWIILSDVMSRDIIFHRISKGQFSGTTQVIRIPKNSMFFGENSFLNLSTDAVRFEHPGPAVEPSGCCMLGVPLEYDKLPVIIEVKLISENGVIKSRLFELNSDPADGITPSGAPGGGVDCRLRWFRLCSQFESTFDLPVAWEISVVQGSGCVLAAFWHDSP